MRHRLKFTQKLPNADWLKGATFRRSPDMDFFVNFDVAQCQQFKL